MFLTFLLFWDASTWGTRLWYLDFRTLILDTRYSALTLVPRSMIDSCTSLFADLLRYFTALLPCHPTSHGSPVINWVSTR